MDVNNSERDKPQGHYENAPNKFVCPDCVGDDFLKNRAQSRVSKNTCDYCARQEDKPIAAPIRIVLQPIRQLTEEHLINHEEWKVGMVRSGSSEDDLEGIRPIESPVFVIIPPEEKHLWHRKLWNDIEETIGGGWQFRNLLDRFKNPLDHRSTALKSYWENFETTVKTQTRYFFDYKPSHGSRRGHPPNFLKAIGAIIEKRHLIYSLSANTSLYRVRESHDDKILDSFDTLGPPPEGKASAGRMNPAGISYFYLAKEARTALGEVINRPPCSLVLAHFTTRSPVTVYDLTKLPQPPSKFDLEKFDTRQLILFLEAFIKLITQPVLKDDKEHIDYVPSQVVSEYFAHVFTTKDNRKIDGMIYPSAVVPGGKNIVLFPQQALRWNAMAKADSGWKNHIELTDHKRIKINDWNELTTWISAKK